MKAKSQGIQNQIKRETSVKSEAKQMLKYKGLFDHLKTMTSAKLLPCVVFCQSRRECEDIAGAMDRSIDYTNGQQKGKIKQFIKKSLQRLKECDRDIPQLVTVSNLLVRGIGFHHAGMIPIAKELVEILFADGFLSVVFATKTLAIGINMPARSVMFLNVIEYFGGDRKTMPASEYLQMSGRAGRRGKDERGNVLMFLDNNYTRPPKKDDISNLLESSGQVLES
jgi:superfamily II RNA helicase